MPIQSNTSYHPIDRWSPKKEGASFGKRVGVALVKPFVGAVRNAKKAGCAAIVAHASDPNKASTKTGLEPITMLGGAVVNGGLGAVTGFVHGTGGLLNSARKGWNNCSSKLSDKAIQMSKQ